MTTTTDNAQCAKILEQYGLDKHEAALYLSSLSLHEASMSEIAKKAGIKRSSAYLVFKTLEQKGLMGSFKMKKGLRFVATQPEILISKSQLRLNDLQTILPQLKSLSEKSDHKPKITFYEGEEGYKIMTEDSLKLNNNTLRHIGSITELHKIIGEKYDFDYYIPNRIKRKNFLKAIYSADVSEMVKNLNDSKELREIRYLPKKYECKTATLIYGNKVAITSTKKELITIIIESEEIAGGERAKFDLIWDLLGTK